LQMETDYGVFNAIKRNTSFSSFRGQQVSIFSLNTEVAITVSRLRYPIVDRRLTSWWQGTLNEATDTRFSIQVSGSDALVIVFRNY
ncbi:MAG: thiamine diphosphokinase, partial [Tannerellaceae bacterium]